MPYKRRQDGLTAADRRLESRLWNELLAFLAILGNLAINPALNALALIAGLVTALALLTRVSAMRIVQWQPHARIDKVS